MSFEGGAFNFVEQVKQADSFFNGDDGADQGRFAETSAYLGQTDGKLAGEVAANRSAEHGHPGVESEAGGPDYLRMSAAERSPGTAMERSESHASEHRTEVAELNDEIDFFMDPMPTGAERAPETAMA